MLGPNQNGEAYTDHMSQELIAIISAAIVLAGIIGTGQWAMRRDITALGERVGKVELGLVDRVRQAGSSPCRAHSQTRSGDGRIHQASIHSTVTQIGG